MTALWRACLVEPAGWEEKQHMEGRARAAETHKRRAVGNVRSSSQAGSTTTSACAGSDEATLDALRRERRYDEMHASGWRDGMPAAAVGGWRQKQWAVSDDARLKLQRLGSPGPLRAHLHGQHPPKRRTPGRARRDPTPPVIRGVQKCSARALRVRFSWSAPAPRLEHLGLELWWRWGEVGVQVTTSQVGIARLDDNWASPPFSLHCVKPAAKTGGKRGRDEGDSSCRRTLSSLECARLGAFPLLGSKEHPQALPQAPPSTQALCF